MDQSKIFDDEILKESTEIRTDLFKVVLQLERFRERRIQTILYVLCTTNLEQGGEKYKQNA
jgi:hypothetical protein